MKKVGINSHKKMQLKGSKIVMYSYNKNWLIINVLMYVGNVKEIQKQYVVWIIYPPLKCFIEV